MFPTYYVFVVCLFDCFVIVTKCHLKNQWLDTVDTGQVSNYYYLQLVSILTHVQGLFCSQMGRLVLKNLSSFGL